MFLNKYIRFVIFFIISACSYFAKAQDSSVETIVQTGHYAGINDVTYSTDGHLIATASNDKTIKLWLASNGKEIRSFTGSDAPLIQVAINNKQNYILAVNTIGEILVWELMNGRLSGKYTPESDVYTCAAFHPEKETLVTGTKKSSVIILDLLTGKQLAVYNANAENLSYSKDFEYTESKTVMFSSDGKYILAGSQNKTAIVWDVASQQEIRKYKKTRNTCISCLTEAVITHDNKFVITAFSDSVKVFDFTSGKLIRELSYHNGSMSSLVLSPDDRFIAVEQYGSVIIWELASGKVINTLSIPSYRMTSVAFSIDAKTLITGNENRMSDIWNIKAGNRLLTLRGYLNNIDERILNHSFMYWASMVNETKLSPDGKYIAVGRTGNNANLIDFQTGHIDKIFKGHHGIVICLGFSNDGKYLATGGIDGKAILWNIETGQPKQTFCYRDSTLAIFSLDISPGNKYLATADWAGYVVLWDIETGKYIKSLYPHNGTASYHVKFSSNGLYIISAGLDRKLKLVEIDTGEEIRELKGHTNLVTSINLHPKEDKIITGGWDNTIRIWDFYSGLQIKKIDAHKGGVCSAKFDSSGNYIISGGNDNLAKIWDANSGELLAHFTGHRGGVGEVNISNDHRFLVTGGRDGAIKIWDVKNKEELVSLIFPKDEEWFIGNPSGYFDASPGAFQEISFVKGTELFMIDRFFDGFYTPGLYKKAVFNENAEFRDHIFKQVGQSPPPSVEIITPEPGECNNRNVVFMVKVTNQGGGVSELKVMHNGKRLDVDDSDLKRIKNEGQYLMKNFEVILVPGNNEFTISALSNALIESESVKINLALPGTPKNSNCYIFCVGINKYENSVLDLNYARPDAEAFAKIVKTKGHNLFNTMEFFLLLDNEATREAILNRFNLLCNKIMPDDVFIFFYAGHGSMVDNLFYFSTTESTGLYQKDKLRNTISAGELQEKLKSIKALKQVLFIDACHSGSSIDLLAARGANEEKALAQLSRSSGIHVMASSESQQQAAEIKSLGHGVFTFVLLEALMGKADGAPKDNKVTIYELKSYIDDQVPEVSFRLIQHKQFPSTFSIGHDFPLVME